MLSREERIATLAEANRVRQQRKREAVGSALRQSLREKMRVNVSAVAQRAGVSRNFIYGQPDLFDMIQDAAAGQAHRLHRPQEVSSTEASLRARLVTALDALNAAKQEITKLESQVERLTGELSRRITGAESGENRVT